MEANGGKNKMSLLDKWKKKSSQQEVTHDSMNELIEVPNYSLTEVKKEKLNVLVTLPIEKLSQLGTKASPLAMSLKNVVKKVPKGRGVLYRVENMKKGDILKPLKDGKTKWGAIRRADGTSTMAKLKEVKPQAVAIDPTSVMIAMALASVENDLNEIKDISQRIITFLEEEKEAEIESDLEMLTRIIKEYKYNYEDSQYLNNHHMQVMDIKRTANKNMLFYRKQIEDELEKNKLMTTSQAMNAIQKELEKKFQYYRMSLYIYSFSTFIEIMLLKNFEENYLMAKSEELIGLDNEYIHNFQKASEYIKKNAGKLLEGNLIWGLGSAQNALGNLAEKLHKKREDADANWLQKQGENLQKIGEGMKNHFSERFEDTNTSGAKIFVDKVEEVNHIYNHTANIYFDEENLYLEGDGKEMLTN